VRIACTKTLPTDEQIFEGDFEDAGIFFLTMQNDPKLSDVFEAFVVDFAHRWDEELPQPAERAVEHVLVWWLRVVDEAIGKGGLGSISELELTIDKVQKFKKSSGSMSKT